MPRRRTGPTSINERIVVQLLRQLRERANLTPQEASRALPKSGSQRVWRLETGRVAPQPRVVEQLLALYGASEDETADCLTRLQAARRRPWWDEYKDVLADQLIGRLDLESEAELIRIYAPGHWPELLATPDLIQATLAHTYPHDPPHLIARRVDLHLRRIEVALQRATPVRIWAVIEEAVLHREIASPAVMRKQIRHLERLREERTVTVQILPCTRSSEIQLSGSMQLVRCDHHLVPDTLIYRTPVGVSITQEPQQVESGRLLFEQAAVHAHRPTDPLPPTRH